MPGFFDKIKSGADKAAFEADRLRRVTQAQSVLGVGVIPSRALYDGALCHLALHSGERALSLSAADGGGLILSLGVTLYIEIGRAHV